VIDRMKVMEDLGITDQAFNDLQQLLEARMPGKWSRLGISDRALYVYKRTE
jgi:hypothetical protein